MKKISNISIAIATFNEAENIKRCLDSVIDWVDEVVIVDGHSTDDTVSLIKKYHGKIKLLTFENKPIFHINKQKAIDYCRSDWILQLDADEVISPLLKSEILKILSSSVTDISYSGFWINRKNYFLSKFLSKGGAYPDPTLRLYKRGLGRLPCKSVHEQAEVKGNVGYLENDLLHYADYSFSRYLLRNNRYTSLIADELKLSKLPLNIFSFILYFFIKPVFWFLKTYFRHLGFLDGFPGFVFSWYSSLRFPIAYIKYFEKIHRHEF